MGSKQSDEPTAPSPLGATSLDDLVARLAELRTWAGEPSYSELVRRIREDRAGRGLPPSEQTPGRVTVYDCFRPGRKRLDVELVVDVVTALGAGSRADEWRAAHHAVVTECDAARVVRVHDQLPPASPHFVGREAELASLARDERPVSIIVGMPGAGKTELALQAAHACAHEYDAHLYVDLRGHDADHPAVDPQAALGSLLRALGTSGNDVHLATAGQRRSMLDDTCATTRVLLVLDNARDAAQVRPLLPRRGDGRVLVTSRRSFVVGRAEPVEVPQLSATEAVELLARASGAELGDGADALRLTELCGRLPLLLKVLAGHLATTSTWSLADQVRRLEAVSPESAVQGALAASYRGLPDAEQRLLRLLALHPGGWVSVPAAAALLGAPVARAGEVLAGLVAEHLVDADPLGRHRLHDVIASFAGHLARDLDPHSAQQEALARLVEHQVGGVRRAVHHLRPLDVALPDGDGLPRLPDLGAALEWLRLECENVVATALAAGHAGLPDGLADIADALQPWLEADVRYAEMETLSRAMVTSPRPEHRRDGARMMARVHDQTGQLDQALHWSLQAVATAGGDRDMAVLTQHGNVLVRLARLEEASAAFESALEVARQSGNRWREGRVLGNLAGVARLLGDLEVAESRFTEAMAVSRELGDLDNQAILNTNLSDLFVLMERYDDALAALQASIGLDEQLGARQHVPGSMIRMGQIHTRRGEHQRGLEILGEAIELAVDFGERIYVAEGLNTRGDAWLRHGDCDLARHDRLEARRIGEEICSEWVVVDATNGLGEISRCEGDLTAAVEHFSTALAAALRIGSAEETQRAREGLAACIAAGAPA